MAEWIMVAIMLELALNPALMARPNVVLVMTDDQGYGDFGATGNRVMETPVLDGMAAGGAWLTTFYVSPVCSPTRACLMTGRYNYRTRCIDTYLGRSMMDPEEVTIAEVLAQAGYATGIFGKWHLGDCFPMRPMDQGFQEALVHRGGGLAQPSEPRENGNRYTDPILFHNGKEVQTTGYCTDVYFEAALKFMENSHAAGKPFFVYLPCNAPHGPFHDVPETLRKHYLTKDLAGLIVGRLNPQQLKDEVDRLSRIAAMITNIDQNMGRLLDKLNALGVAQDTLVLFLVDNGPNTRRYVGPFRGMKSEVYEGGIRSPLWAHWPSRIKAGTRRAELAAHIDLMPTILEACRVTSPPGLKLDGRSLLPLLLGQEPPWPDRTLVIQSHRGDEPVRYHHFMIRDQRWKLVHPSGFGREQFEGAPRFELYDLGQDPGEQKNVLMQNPEVAERLKQAYEAWFDDVSHTRPDNYAPPRIHVGAMQEPVTVLTRQDWRGGTWAARSIGHWDLKVTQPGIYRVRLAFDAAPAPETAELRVGGTIRRREVASGQTACEMTDLELPAGDTRLEAWLDHEAQRRGVYQVEMERR